MQKFFQSANPGRLPAVIICSGLVAFSLLSFPGNKDTVSAAQIAVPMPISAPVAPVQHEPVRVDTASVERLVTEFSDAGFELDLVLAGEADVPRILPTSVPADMAAMKDAKQRKQVFFKMMLPMVLTINESLLEDRDRIEALRAAAETGAILPPRDQAWLDERFKEYKVEDRSFDTLLNRVDIVPPSLALAQAAIESGWGTSRFAREGNALFGQWTTDAYKGIVPKNRGEGKTHKIRAFHAPLDAVASYMRNLNTHRAYEGLRDRRQQLRNRKQPLDSLLFADTLTAYSEKGGEYVRLLKQVINGNDLRLFDGAALTGDGVVRYRPSA